MGRIILCHNARFLEWSTIRDAPVTESMDALTFRSWYVGRYGEGSHSLRDSVDVRMGRALRTGSSSRAGETLQSCMEYNRAGPGETPLSPDEFLGMFDLRRTPLPGVRLAPPPGQPDYDEIALGGGGPVTLGVPADQQAPWPPRVTNASLARMALGHVDYWTQNNRAPGSAGAATVRMALRRLLEVPD